MTICVFLGPTMSHDDARQSLDAIYLPPVRRGDVSKAVVTHRPHTLAIIDGYFEQVPSVWHKELLWAMQQGIAVYGAASMGALRAAELAQFGMVGIGRIFEAYSSGRFEPFDDPFEGDDEVAVVHGPAELGYPGSDALVDIRATLAEAMDAAILGERDARTILTVAKSIFYKQRIWKAVLSAALDAGVPAAVCSALRSRLSANKSSQKRRDAETLLRHIRDSAEAPAAIPFHFERTLLFERVHAQDLAGEAR